MAHQQEAGSIAIPQFRGPAVHALVFAAYFISAGFCLYLYFSLHTSPALIWVPLGIAIAAVTYGGYGMAIPIFLAHALALIFYSPVGYQTAVVTGAGYALESAAALWALRRLRFTPDISILRNSLILVGAAFAVTTIAPLIGTAYVALDSAHAPLLLTFARAWGGGVFSVLVVSSLIFSWITPPAENRRANASAIAERIVGFIALAVLTYLVFWTLIPQSLGIIVIFIIPAVLIWFALRFPIRYMTLGLFASSALGIAGSIIAHPSAATTALNVQLLADEIYMGFIAAIYIVFVAVVEERRASFSVLRTLYREAAESNAKKNEFIAVLAHELRNPLAPLVASLELLSFEPQTEAAKQEIAEAKAHITMIRRLLDDLLDTARLTQSRFTLRKESVRFKDVVALSVAAVAELCHARKLTLTVAPVDEQLYVEADPVRLTQVLMNLLINAAKYTEPGGSIYLTFATDGDYLSIKIADTGIGIDEEHLLTIFEPFQRSASLPGRYGTGLGLGLYLARELTRLHGGTIEATSAGPGKGSTFTVTLPIVWERPKNPEEHKAPAPGSKNILLVDDNEAFVSALNRLLSHFGHSVSTAYSGKEALARVKESKPQVVFLDIGMPEMDGYQVARAMRGEGVAAPIVALTGYGQEEDRERSKQAGFDYHLVKPVSLDELQTLLRDIEKAGV